MAVYQRTEAICAAETDDGAPSRYKVVRLPGPFPLEMGGALRDISVAYETFGRLNARRSNTILVTHALTGDSHVGRSDSSDPAEGWWEGLVGPGRGLDTERFFVVCSNVLGGCRGTTGPSSINPATGNQYGSAFPTVTVKDMVRIQKALLDHLRIKKLRAVTGGSLGGMQALQWAVSYPDAVETAVVLASPGRTSPQSIAYNEVQRAAIMADPNWRNGDYYAGEAPLKGMSIARMLGMITYHSHASMERKFGRRTNQAPGAVPRFDVEGYLHYQGEKLSGRFDPNTYVCLTKAMDLFDIGAGYPSYRKALQRIRARVRVIGITTDILYPPHQQRELVRDLRAAGVVADYEEIESPWGHDGFLIEMEALEGLFKEFLHEGKPGRQVTAV